MVVLPEWTEAEIALADRITLLEAVAEAAQGVINCLDLKPDDRVWDHASGGACLNLLDETLNALNSYTG
jgi:hypothetical protein